MEYGIEKQQPKQNKNSVVTSSNKLEDWSFGNMWRTFKIHILIIW